MRSLWITLLGAAFFVHPAAFADLFDDFEDGDYTSDPAWLGSEWGEALVDGDPLRPGNLALKMHGTGQATCTLRTYLDHPWFGFDFSYEVYASDLMRRSDYLNDTSSDDYFLRFDLIYDEGPTSNFKVFQQGTGFVHDQSFVGVPDEWWRVHVWHDPIADVIEVEIRDIATSSLLTQTSFTPSMDLSVPSRRVEEVILSVRPTTWGFYDNISLGTGSPIVVDSLDDPGDPNDGLTTLREAIDAANLAGGLPLAFDPNLAGGTIQPASPLPTLTAGCITIGGDIDDDGVPDIELDGSLAGASDGLLVVSANNVIDGLVINRFQYSGIKLYGSAATGNTVTNCYVGTDRIGATALPNLESGIWLQDGPFNNTIGPGNLISGNTAQGISLSGAATTGNHVVGNFVGTDATGSTALPNGAPGIIVSTDASNNTIGPDNLVSGNNSQGIVLTGGAHFNTVISNTVGTDLTGSYSIENYWDGIVIQGAAHHNQIGGAAGQGNLFSGNRASGILIRDLGSDFNVVSGNYCGTDITGTTSISNGDYGIGLYNGPSENAIGPGNVVSGNQSNGIRLSSGVNGTHVHGNLVGTSAGGDAALGNGMHGVHLGADTWLNEIGPDNVVSANGVSSDTGDGIVLEGTNITDNVVWGNIVGADASGTQPLPNRDEGIAIVLGASHNTVGPDNLIAFNTNQGVQLYGANSIRNTITQNSIHANGGRGILLVSDANEGIECPYNLTLTATEVTGYADVPDGSIVEVFIGPDNEGQTYVGETVVVGGVFVLDAVIDPSLMVTATVTDPDGNTSEFGLLCTSETGLITDCEGFDLGTRVMFQSPRHSPTTDQHLVEGLDTAEVTDEAAFSGTQSYKIEWQFVDEQPYRWMRLHTNGTAFLPNPTIHYATALRLRMLVPNGSFYLCMGTRETGTHACIGDDGGGWSSSGPNFTIEFLGATEHVEGADWAPRGTRLISGSDEWQTVEFLIPAEPVLPLSGDGVLYTPNQKGTLEELAILINTDDPNPVGPFTIYVDDIELIDPGTLDCNGNGVPDADDIMGGTSMDCNGNSVPDECEWADCNENGIPDDCDIADGTSRDCDLNGVPDECDDCLGDIAGAGDGIVGLDDLSQLLSHYGTTEGMTYQDGDLDCDGDVDLRDLAMLLSHYGNTCE